MNQKFITSYLTFYLKATIGLEGDFIKTSSPNTILKLIPLGSQNKTIPVTQIASINDNFSLDFKAFCWGIVFIFVSFQLLNQNVLFGIIALAYAILTILSAFQTSLVLNMTSGNTHIVNVILFQKSKLLNCKETIDALIQKRYDDTNVAMHTAIQTEKLVDAIKGK